MNRELTKRETAMLLFLVILVIALGYFKLIFEPIQDQTVRYQSDTVQEQSELELELVRLDQMQKMQQNRRSRLQRRRRKLLPRVHDRKWRSRYRI